MTTHRKIEYVCAPVQWMNSFRSPPYSTVVPYLRWNILTSFYSPTLQTLKNIVSNKFSKIFHFLLFQLRSLIHTCLQLTLLEFLKIIVTCKTVFNIK